MTASNRDVLIVGAGFSGLYILRKLLDKDFSVELVDDGDGPGGTWDKNRYPGARVDSPIWVYQFTDSRLWRPWYFSEKYPDWTELEAYFRHVCDTWQLWPHMSFNERVTSAQFDERSSAWKVQTSKGREISARYVVFATGSTTQPIDLHMLFPGVDTFRGEVYHSARWPRGKTTESLRGQKVAVIGTGASGVQIIQDVALVADQLVVFQRTPNLALPMKQERFTRREYELVKQQMPASMERSKQTFAGFDYDFIFTPWREIPPQDFKRILDENWEEGGFKFWLGGVVDLLFDEDCNRIHYDYWRDHQRRRIRKPELVEKLTPTEPPHPFGVKRPCLEQWYFEVYNQDNVTLVDVNETPIERFNERGIVAGGKQYDFDVVICAVGFDNNTGTLTAIDVRNSQGVTVADVWGQEYLDYLGKMIPGFPNLFYTYGLHSPAAFLNGPTAAELEGDWVVHVLSDMRARGIERVEPKLQPSKEWHQHVLDLAAPSLFYKAKSWYVGANVPGKRVEMLQYPGGAPAYRQKLWEEVEKGYPNLILGREAAVPVG